MAPTFPLIREGPRASYPGAFTVYSTPRLQPQHVRATNSRPRTGVIVLRELSFDLILGEPHLPSGVLHRVRSAEPVDVLLLRQHLRRVDGRRHHRSGRNRCGGERLRHAVGLNVGDQLRPAGVRVVPRETERRLVLHEPALGLLTDQLSVDQGDCVLHGVWPFLARLSRSVSFAWSRDANTAVPSGTSPLGLPSQAFVVGPCQKIGSSQNCRPILGLCEYWNTMTPSGISRRIGRSSGTVPIGRGLGISLTAAAGGRGPRASCGSGTEPPTHTRQGRRSGSRRAGRAHRTSGRCAPRSEERRV